MNLRKDIVSTIQELKRRRDFKSQADVAEYLGYNVSYFSRVLNSDDIPIDFEEKFFNAFPRKKYLNSNDDFLSHLPEPAPKENPTAKEAMKQLGKIQNGRSKNKSDGKVLSSDDVVSIKTFVIPMKGFAGLKRAIYNDQYITEHFEETTTQVPHHLYSPISYRIQSSGESMPKSIPNNAWVTGVPVSEDIWYSYKFDPERVYIFFHPYRGILFKQVQRLSEMKIKLSSENEDKIEYEDEEFEITEFRKILLAIKVETFI